MRTHPIGRAVLVGMCALAWCGGASAPNRHPLEWSVSANGPAAQRLTSSGQALRLTYLDSGQLPDLHFPDFTDYQIPVRTFYEGFAGCLPWIRDGKPSTQGRTVITILEDAAHEGLRPEDYDGPLWNARLSHIDGAPDPTETALITFDLALTVSTMRYVSDLRFGRVDPREFHFEIEGDHGKFDLSKFLTQLVASPDVEGLLASMEPPFPIYRRTKAALARYIELSRRDEGAPLPTPAKAIKPGSAYAGLPQLAKRLQLLGDLRAELPNLGEEYRGDLVSAVKHFQQRHGLDPTGNLDTSTVRELNVPLRQRVIELELTMERVRWLPREFAQPPIVVNIPEFRLHVNDERYHWILSMKVVVGKAYKHQTPVFASEIRSVIFRPYWNVPASILRAELLPLVRKNPLYLKQNSYEIVDRNGNVVSDGTINAELENGLRSGELRVRQTPGPKNALDLIKFDVPSSFSVYLHGTPATELFSRSRRDFSHGCIRVEDPVALAAWVLRNNAGWTEDAIRAAMAGDRTMGVRLAKPIPLLILYSTAVVMENDEVRFFDDIYGQDKTLELVLSESHSGQTSNTSDE